VRTRLTKFVLPAVAAFALMLGSLPALGQEATEMPEAGTPSLVGSTWQWVHFGSGAEAFDVTSPDYTVTFTEAGRLYVRADCNVGSGSYTVDGSTITVGEMATTRALCPPESLSQDFLQALGRAAVF
jgi:heat shock protein HslJ